EVGPADFEVSTSLGGIIGVRNRAQVVDPICELEQLRLGRDLPQMIQIPAVAIRLLSVRDLLLGNVFDEASRPLPKRGGDSRAAQPVAVFEDVMVEGCDQNIDIPATQLLIEDDGDSNRMVDKRRSLVAPLLGVGSGSEPECTRQPLGVLRMETSKNVCERRRRRG